MSLAPAESQPSAAERKPRTHGPWRDLARDWRRWTPRERTAACGLLALMLTMPLLSFAALAQP